MSDCKIYGFNIKYAGGFCIILYTTLNRKIIFYILSKLIIFKRLVKKSKNMSSNHIQNFQRGRQSHSMIFSPHSYIFSISVCFPLFKDHFKIYIFNFVKHDRQFIFQLPNEKIFSKENQNFQFSLK